MSAPSRPVITSSPPTITYGATFELEGTLYSFRLPGTVQVVLSAPGFHTHAVAMGQRMVMLASEAVAYTTTFNVTAPNNGSVMQPGIHLLFLVNDGIPSEGVWVKLQE